MIENRVSVIIPFYRNIQWLEEAIKSAIDQTYKDCEIIVINDGSSEDDREMLRKFEKQIIHIKTKNRGPGAARNLGIEVSTGEFISFLDSDDLWLPDKTDRQIRFMKSTGAVWSHSSYFVFYDGVESKIEFVDATDFKGKVYPRCLIRSKIATPCVMIRTEYLRNNPYVRFSSKMRYGQDGFMWLHLAVENELFVLPESLIKVRMRGDNAVQRARVHLKVRADLWSYLKTCDLECFRLRPLDPAIGLVYNYCYFGNKLVERLNRFTNRKLVIEIFSKLVYCPAFVLFRIYSLRYSSMS